MSEKLIRLLPPDIDPWILELLPNKLKENIKDPGKSLRTLESLFISELKVKYALAVSSGTAALHLALLTLGVKEGDEVICPSFTFVATLNAISYLKAVPVIVDSEMDTWNISPELLESAIQDRISKGKIPKAMILTHTYGVPACISEVMDICKKFDISVIEDAAGSLGSKYQRSYLGGFGDVGIISFNYNKILTTCGGGILLTNNPEIRSKAALLATQARSNRPFYYHEHIGYNYQMNGFAAELGIAQFDSLENRVIKKRNIFQKYYEELSDYPFIQFQLEHKDVYSNRWLTTLLLNEPSVALELKKYMMQNDIEIRHLWKPMHQQPVFKDVPKYLNGNSEWLFDHGIALPSGTNLNHLQHDRILKAIHGFLKLTLKS